MKLPSGVTTLLGSCLFLNFIEFFILTITSVWDLALSRVKGLNSLFWHGRENATDCLILTFNALESRVPDSSHSTLVANRQHYLAKAISTRSYWPGISVER